MEQKIYIADEDPGIRELVSMNLKNSGYMPSIFPTGGDLYHAFEASPCDLVILDITLQGEDGFTVCRNLRSISDVPIMILSARSEESDIIHGFVFGADDYITIPFSSAVLVARVSALLRRAGPRVNANSVRKCGDLLLSPDERKVFSIGDDLEMTPTEYSLFSCLLDKPGQAVSREYLLQNVWNINSQNIETRVTDETVRRIRQKLKRNGSSVKISSVWGYGYQLDLFGEE